MKPNQIYDVMDLAQRARENDQIFNPLFVGAPGIGKSQIVQDWCKKKSLPFIDLRAAYLEAPDLIGFPSIEIRDGRQITVHNIPEFWPQTPDWKGVILLEEPNRGTTSVMNTFMQLLTDRKVHKYELPQGAIVVGCINPESEYFDVNTMDAALKDRFEIFEVVYDKVAFLDFMKMKTWDERVQMFVETGTWKYASLEDLGNIAGSKYLSPRTFSKLNAALKSGVTKELELTIYESILGKNVGQSFFQFVNDEQPVLYKDIVESTNKSLRRLTKFSDAKDYKSGHITITIRDIVEKNDIKDELLSEVALVLPADQSLDLLKQLSFKRKDDGLLERIIKDFPEVKKYLKAVLVK